MRATRESTLAKTSQIKGMTALEQRSGRKPYADKDGSGEGSASLCNALRAGEERLVMIVDRPATDVEERT